MLLVYVCSLQHVLLQPCICNHAHTHYVTEKRLGLVVIGRVNRSSEFTYLPGEEENSWPGGLWRVIELPLLHVYDCLPCAWKVCNIHTFLFHFIDVQEV